ncbi:MAG: hypothetical protein GKR94_04255 [Gammaproteobacteria bacterium]|nr:hypothetical protein [Gammaproteobacteria bacterium]
MSLSESGGGGQSAHWARVGLGACGSCWGGDGQSCVKVENGPKRLDRALSVVPSTWHRAVKGQREAPQPLGVQANRSPVTLATGTDVRFDPFAACTFQPLMRAGYHALLL